jgi:hypothetical protein
MTYEREELGGVAFVPLIGAEGWPDKTGPAMAERLSGYR